MRNVPAWLRNAGRVFMPLRVNESGVNRLRDAHLHLSLQSLKSDDTASICVGQMRR